MTIDYQAARTKMVDNQLRTTDVTDYAVLDAFLAVPREAFVPDRLKPLAYIDDDLEIRPADASGPARHLIEPSPFAKLVQLAELRSGDVVLEIGTGCGYGAAILSRIAASVVALESDEALAAGAASRLSDLGFGNVTVVTGPLAAGCPSRAPFDVIVLSGAVEVLPQAILDQLRDGGRLVAVEGRGNAARAKLYIRDGAIATPRIAFNASVPALPGFERVPTFEF